MDQTQRGSYCDVLEGQYSKNLFAQAVSTRLISIFRVRFSCNVVTRHQSRLIRENSYPLHYVQLSVYFDSLIYTAACRNKAAKDWSIRPTLNFLPSTWNSCRLHYIHSIYKLIDCTGLKSKRNAKLLQKGWFIWATNSTYSISLLSRPGLQRLIE